MQKMGIITDRVPNIGGGWERSDIEHIQSAEPLPSDDLLALDEALTELAQRDPPAAERVQLRFFAGPTQQQAADLPGVSRRIADCRSASARAWPFRQLAGGREIRRLNYFSHRVARPGSK